VFPCAARAGVSRKGGQIINLVIHQKKFSFSPAPSPADNRENLVDGGENFFKTGASLALRRSAAGQSSCRRDRTA